MMTLEVDPVDTEDLKQCWHVASVDFTPYNISQHNASHLAQLSCQSRTTPISNNSTTSSI